MTFLELQTGTSGVTVHAVRELLEKVEKLEKN